MYEQSIYIALNGKENKQHSVQLVVMKKSKFYKIWLCRDFIHQHVSKKHLPILKNQFIFYSKGYFERMSRCNWNNLPNIKLDTSHIRRTPVVLDVGIGSNAFLSFLQKNQKKYIYVPDVSKTLCIDKKKTVKCVSLDIINHLSPFVFHSIIITCNTIASCLLDILLQNSFLINTLPVYEPITPTCKYIQSHHYKHIIILSTPLTTKIRWHERLLSHTIDSILYINISIASNSIMDVECFQDIERRFKQKQNHIHCADCVLLGCSHLNEHYQTIETTLKSYGFSGVLLNSSKILYDFVQNKVL